jgi:hypothetical protein
MKNDIEDGGRMLGLLTYEKICVLEMTPRHKIVEMITRDS